VIELVSLLSELSDIDLLSGFVENLKLADRFDLEHSAYFTYRYEDFLAGNLTALENYLGHSVSFSGSVDQEFVRVARSKRSAIGETGSLLTIYSILSRSKRTS